MAARYPDVRWDKQHIDILTARFVLQPQRFDVVAATNLFGDILSDLGPACTGTIGIAPSRQHEPGAQVPAAVRAGARLGAGHLRQEHRQPGGPDLGRRDDAGLPHAPAAAPTATRTTRSCARSKHVLRDGPRTPDLGGKASTTEMGKAIADRVAEA